jgi:hypothetical protein
MSDDSKRRRGRPALHQNGGSLLVRAPSEPGDEQQGDWGREELIRMNDRFAAQAREMFQRKMGLVKPPLMASKRPN